MPLPSFLKNWNTFLIEKKSQLACLFLFSKVKKRGNPSSDNNCQQFNAIDQHEDGRSTRTHQGSDNHSNGNTSESSSSNLDDLSVRANASDSNASQNF